MDLSISPSGLIFSCCLPCPPISLFHPSRFYFLCLSWHPLKSPKNPRFETDFFIWLCDLRQVLPQASIFPFVQWRDQITSKAPNLPQPRWSSHPCTLLCKALLCKAAHVPPLPPSLPCHLENIKTQLKISSGRSLLLHAHHTPYFSLPFLYATTISWEITEWKGQRRQPWIWAIVSHLAPWTSIAH